MSLDRKIPLIMPNALMAFHWPRVDLDKLLCLRLDNNIIEYIIFSPANLCISANFFLHFYTELKTFQTVSGLVGSLSTKTVPFTSTCEATTATQCSFVVRWSSREPPTTLSYQMQPTTPLLSDLRIYHRYRYHTVSQELVELTYHS